MPPKRTRRAAAAVASTGGGRRSKLARENNISAAQEAEIREVFSLFAEPRRGEPDGVIPIGDVRRALIALNIPPTPAELTEYMAILDPDDEGFATFEPFVAVSALQLQQQAAERDDSVHAREVDAAFALFVAPPGAGSVASSVTAAPRRRFTNAEIISGLANTSRSSASASGNSSYVTAPMRSVAGPEIRESDASPAGSGAKNKEREKEAKEKVITIAGLKRIAAILKEDVDEQLLRDMILEANGGTGVAYGVRKDEFDAVMRRANAWR